MSLDREKLVVLALEQLLAQMDCRLYGAPGPGWRENYQIRAELADDGPDTSHGQYNHELIVTELKAMVAESETVVDELPTCSICGKPNPLPGVVLSGKCVGHTKAAWKAWERKQSEKEMLS